jgi:hypothetical protein
MAAENLDVIDAIREDHAGIRDLLDEVRVSRDRYAFEQLVRKLTVQRGRRGRTGAPDHAPGAGW